MGVRNGIDRGDLLEKNLKGLRLGLITNNSGVTLDGRSGIEELHGHFDLRFLLAPEHGIRGELGPGDEVENRVDRLSGLPVYSLFHEMSGLPDPDGLSEVFEPPAEIVDRADALVMDIQDVGSRYYTYPSTMFYAMRACAKRGKAFFVLDRPNPLGGEVLEGNCHRPELLSFIGLTRTPIRHSFTMGELAGYYNGEYRLGCDLRVIPMEGWRRSMFFDETALPLVRPSPNLPSLDSIVVYNGSCLLAGTNVSDGRGSTLPFNAVGAPWADPDLLARELNGAKLAGLLFTPVYYIPAFSKYKGEVVGGVQIHVMDKKAVRAVELGIRLIRTFARLYPEKFAPLEPKPGERWHLDIASGSGELREGRIPPKELIEKWNEEAESFRPVHEKYRIYA
jgi:uncharacterized protein YbbC (DUF1343 family)